jgi:hypothetical protein
MDIALLFLLTRLTKGMFVTDAASEFGVQGSAAIMASVVS